jgi:competence protein ComEA
MSRDEWIANIQKMMAAGAQGTEEQFTAVLDYVTKNFGPQAARLNVNKATAAELEAGLGLTSKEAAALVKYRTEKGPFKTIDDLKKVTDLDFKKIEAQKDRLDF